MKWALRVYRKALQVSPYSDPDTEMHGPGDWDKIRWCHGRESGD